jgi:transcriptional regulator with GAF, ATPase, and Fis domain
MQLVVFRGKPWIMSLRTKQKQTFPGRRSLHISFLLVVSGGVLRLPESLAQATAASAGQIDAPDRLSPIFTADEAERKNILRALEATGWRINGPKGAAALLKLHPSTLRFRMKKLGLTKVSSYAQRDQTTTLH